MEQDQTQEEYLINKIKQELVQRPAQKPDGFGGQAHRIFKLVNEHMVFRSEYDLQVNGLLDKIATLEEELKKFSPPQQTELIFDNVIKARQYGPNVILGGKDNL